MNHRNQKNTLIMYLILLVGFIVVGYAILQANLQINGTTKIANNTWNVYFDHIEVNSESISIGDGDSAASIDSNNNCKVDFTISLTTPGDFYEFTVDVVNAGSIDAMIGFLNKELKINNEVVDSTPSYLNYTVTYDDDVEILPKHKLSKNTTETYKVRVEYRKDIDELPDATTISTSVEIQYVQADDTAILPQHLIQPKVPVTDTIYWALQDNNNDGDYEKLVISDSEVSGSDNYQGSFAGTTVFNSFLEVPWNCEDYYGGISNKVEQIKIEGTVAPTSTAYWFGGTGHNSETLEGNLNDLNVSNVTDMSHMFYNVGVGATTWNIGDLSGWNTSNVTNMSFLLYFAGNITETWNIGNLSKWDTSNVTDMSNMFHGAGQNSKTWNIGNLNRWNTSHVTNMSWMFGDAGKYATTWNIGDLSRWDTSNVTDMSNMFSSAAERTSTWNIGDINLWNTSNVTDMSSMFDYAGYTATNFNINLSNWDTSNVTSFYYMFSYAGFESTNFNLNLNGWNSSHVTNMSYMFSNAGANASTWNIGDISGWNTSNVTDISNMFSSTGTNVTTWSIGDLSRWDTSNVESMYNMFSYAGKNATNFNLDLSRWDTSNVTDMTYMFYNSGYNATTWSIGDLSNWNTSNVEFMNKMFSNAGYNATNFNLNLSGWNTSKVKKMSNMFLNSGYTATTWNIKIPSTNGGSINNTTTRLYGTNTSNYAAPDSGREFTLA